MILTIWQRLLVNNDLHIVDLPVLTEPINGVNAEPQVVRIENLELGDRLELVNVLLGDLSDLEQAGTAFVLNQSATLDQRILPTSNNQSQTHLDIGTCLVRHFHTELGLWVLGQIGQNVQVNSGAEIVNVGEENLKHNV